jgi:dTDP-4-amino-4,6-dideoxygalactose transaminase
MTRVAQTDLLCKSTLSDLAIFGGPVAFERVRPTSDLSRPEFATFLRYSRLFFDAHWYSNDGPVNRELESRLAQYHEVERCVTFSSGFWGLVLAMKTVALSDRTEVIMPSITYRRLADAAFWAGLTPHFADVDPDSLASSPATMTPLINDNTALILGVHPIVNCCDATGLETLSRSTGIPLLIDAVESSYEFVDGRRVGTFGSCELFSLHASKLLNGFEGGYMATNDHDLADVLALTRAFGFEVQDQTDHFGVNAKLNEVHAAMALASLDEIAEHVERNQRLYRGYVEQLATLSGLRLLEFDGAQRPGYKNIVARLEDDWPLSRAETLAVLNAEGALARAYYSPPLHTKSTSYPTISSPLPVTEALADCLLVLPSGYHVDILDVEVIASILCLVGSQGSAIHARLVAEGHDDIRA